MQSHINKRSSLYRELGVLRNFIEQADILEVGPGGGYNSIVIGMYNPRSYTLIEPNPAGYNEMTALFEKYNLNTNSIFLVNELFENITLDMQFDLVICEGLLPGLENKSSVISKLKRSVKSGGVLIITTADEISSFLEIARRFIAHKLVNDVDDIHQKATILSSAFDSHLSSLGVSTRPIIDWVYDVLLNPASCNAEQYYSMSSSLSDIGDEFYYLSSSPNLFTNPTWYKKLENNPLAYNERYLHQFDSCKHSLILQEAQALHRPFYLNGELSTLCSRFGALSKQAEYGNVDFNSCAKEVISICEAIISNLKDERMENILCEFIYLAENTTMDNIRNTKYFQSAFGKGQQYISFVKC